MGTETGFGGQTADGEYCFDENGICKAEGACQNQKELCSGCNRCKVLLQTSLLATAAAADRRSNSSSKNATCLSACAKDTTDDCRLSYCAGCDVCTKTETGFGGQTADGEYCFDDNGICKAEGACQNQKELCSGCN